MLSKKSFSVFVSLFCYLISSSIFSHVQSMNMVREEGEMVMSDCGMMMKASADNTKIDGNCFEKCFGAYDDISRVTVDIPSNYKCYTHTNELLYCDDKNGDSVANNPSQAPPDDRGLVYSNNTPYFSHKDMTQIL